MHPQINPIGDAHGQNVTLKHRLQPLQKAVTKSWNVISKADPDAVQELSEIAKYSITQLADDHAYQSALKRLHQTNATLGWSDISLVNTSRVRAGLIKLYAGNHIPLHNHPDSIGVLVLLSGQLIVDQFDQDIPLKSQIRNGPLYLHRVRRSLLRSGSLSLVLPESGNVHQLRSKGPRSCVFVDILICRTRFSSRHWFFPIESTGNPDGLVRVQPVSNGTLRSTVIRP